MPKVKKRSQRFAEQSVKKKKKRLKQEEHRQTVQSEY